ncbi:unnamed protein product [Dovyalis caffra]|uniref:Uncharacterized protein n=1 Tax=Dovyalis caffra TaxID=77055 RepID=A0AAV1RTR7_9ROSI|nr:unnamed protein product [Dovyalis caffra]
MEKVGASLAGRLTLLILFFFLVTLAAASREVISLYGNVKQDQQPKGPKKQVQTIERDAESSEEEKKRLNKKARDSRLRMPMKA